jgi:hypothetical protein
VDIGVLDEVEEVGVVLDGDSLYVPVIEVVI